MPKIAVNIKLEHDLHEALEAARGDVSRTRFIELILEGDPWSKMLMDRQLIRLGIKKTFAGEDGRVLTVVPDLPPEPADPEPELPQSMYVGMARGLRRGRAVEAPTATEKPVRAKPVAERKKRVGGSTAPVAAPEEDPPSDAGSPPPSPRKPDPPRERPPRAKPVLTGRLRN